MRTHLISSQLCKATICTYLLVFFFLNYRVSFDYYKQIKPTIVGHVVQSFSRKCMSIHHIHRLLYEYNNFFVWKQTSFDEKEVKKIMSFDSKENASKKTSKYKCKNIMKCKALHLNVKVVQNINLHTFCMTLLSRRQYFEC